jgi:hypothetical protein
LLPKKIKIKIHRNITLLVFYGFEEHRARVSENRAFRKLFGPKMDEVTGNRRRLLNYGLHDLYSSPNCVTTN